MNFKKRFLTILAVLVVAAYLVWAIPIERGLDLRGGAVLTYRIDTAGMSVDERADRIKDTVDTFRKRIDTFGLKEVAIEKAGLSSVKVEIPGRESAEADRIVKLLSQTGKLEFRIVATDADPVKGGGSFDPDRENKRRLEALTEGRPYVAPEGLEGDRYHGFKWYPLTPRYDAQENVLNEGEGLWVRLDTWNFTGADLNNIRVYRATRGAGMEVGFGVDVTRANSFGDFTGPNSEEQNNPRDMAIILDGQVSSAPRLKSRLQGGGSITGGNRGFTQEQAEDLANVLKSGALQVKPVLESQYSVGPSLGEDAIRKGFTAIVIGFGAVLLLMVFYYRLQGMIANIAVLLNLLILMGALAFLGSSLSLPGIAGIVLTVGMAVDANVLILERIREERTRGKTPMQAVKNGYDRAFVAIIDSNLTTILTGVVLYLAGSGAVKGFAITLILGILASMFTALFVTRTIVTWLLERKILEDIRLPKLMFGTPKLDYMRVRPLMIGISFVVVVGGLIFFERTGQEKYDIDFTGGSEVRIELRQKMAIGDVRARVRSAVGEASVVTVKSSRAAREDLNLDRESTAFRIAAPIRDTDVEGTSEEVLKNEFEAKVVQAFAAELLPAGVSSRKVGDADGAELKERFSGGWRFALNFEAPVGEAEVRAMAAQAGLPADAHFAKLPPWSGGDPGGDRSTSWAILARVPSFTGTQDDVIRFHDGLTAAADDADLSLTEPVPSTIYIGSVEAESIRTSAFIAVLFSLIIQILYIAFRFRGFSYGFAAVIALIHDVGITLGIVALVDTFHLVDAKLNLPIIAAFLTLIGYSMNDTIVVFDRIRENRRRWKDSFSNLINLSINQNLSRTIRMSVTTFVVLAVIFVINYRAGSVLEGFSFVMLVGVVVGTYSSVFVASPMLMFLPWFWRKFSDAVLDPLWNRADAARWVTWLPLAVLLLLTPVLALLGLFRWIFLADADRAMNLAIRTDAAA